MKYQTKIWGGALALLMALPQWTMAQDQKATVDTTPAPVSYVRGHQKTVKIDNVDSQLSSVVSSRLHAKSKLGKKKLLQEHRTGFKDLMQAKKPFHINADMIRKANAKRKAAKAPFLPENDHKHLIVNMIYCSEDESMANGIYALDVETGELTCLVPEYDGYENYGINGGGYIWNGKYRSVFYEQDTQVGSDNPAIVLDYNMDDWTLASVSENTMMTSMALETATYFNADGTTTVFGQFWGVDAKGNLSLRYCTLDPDGVTTTKFGQSGTKHMLAMGITNEGRLYGVAKDGNLYEINRGTGKEQLVGHTGVSDLFDYEGHFWLQGGEIDPRDNTFYWVAEHSSVYKTELCSVDLSTGKATVLVDFAGDVECAAVVVAPQQKQDDTPSAPSDLTASFGSLQKIGSGSFKAPTTCFDGKPLAADAQLYYQIYVNGVKQASTNDKVALGAVKQFSISSDNVADNGENEIKVTVTLGTDGEESLPAKTTAWVGYGIPQAPQNVSMTFNEAANVVTVTWQHPVKGENAGVKGGAVDQVAYYVYRMVDGERLGDIHQGKPLADDVTSITYTLSSQDLNGILSDLSFAVEAWAAPAGTPLKALASDAATTDGLLIGKGLEVPYWVDFGNDYDNVRQKDFTIINSNNDKYTWEFIPPHMSMGQQLSGAVACGNYTSVNGADDWFITPGIALKAGKSYHFKTNGHGPSAGTSWFEHMEVKAGTNKSVESMTVPVINATPVINYMAVEGNFTVPEDGNYYFGLHSVSAPSQWEIAIFDISITETDMSTIDPLAPADGAIAATPVYGVTEGTDAAGKTVYYGAADVKLSLPTTTADGTKLSASDRLDVSLTVSNGTTSQVVAEYSGQAPGTVIQYKAENMLSGEYTFCMRTSFTADGAKHLSPVASSTAYVGWDNAVTVPSGVKSMQTGNKLTFLFPEQEEVKGVHGAYLPSISYRAYNGNKAPQLAYYLQNGQTYIFDFIAADAQTDGTELQIPDLNAEEGLQYMWKWYVVAVSTDAKGQKIYSDLKPITAIIGEPVQAPAMETGEQTFLLDAEFSDDLYETWNYYLNRGSVVCGIQPIDDQFGHDVGKSWNAYSAFNGDILLHFSKVNLSALAAPQFDCDIILEDTNTDMEIIFNGPDGKQAIEPMRVMDGMQHISIPLNEYVSWGWVQPTLKVNYHLEVDGDNYHDVFFDNVGIYDAQPVNLSMIGFEVPSQLNSGEEVMANVTIMNMGQQAVKDYTVTLTEDDVVMQSETVAETLNPGEISVVQFRYRANTVSAFDAMGMEDAEKVLVATLACEGDAIENDNSAEAVVTINVNGGKENSYPTDAMARLANDGQGVDVSWNFDIEQPRRVVTESFEDYELWYNGGVKAGAPEGQLGSWRLYDGDNKPTYSFNGLDIVTSYAGEPQAFQVFNGSLFSGMSEYYYYDLSATSGEQYLVSMDPADGNYAPQPDDYLISPMVPGGTNVEFYYGSLVRKPQGIEVLYSETGRDISDFKLLKRLDDASGSDWYFGYFTLPETAKYFAIHHDKSAYLGYGLKIDDITYVKVDAISGFNIYVDGHLVGTSKENAFTIKEGLASGSHKIAVTAIFADGTESVPAYVTYDTELAIRELVSTDKPFDIYSIDGKLVRQQTRSIQGLKGVFIINDKTVVLK